MAAAAGVGGYTAKRVTASKDLIGDTILFFFKDFFCIDAFIQQ